MFVSQRPEGRLRERLLPHHQEDGDAGGITGERETQPSAWILPLQLGRICNTPLQDHKSRVLEGEV